MSERAPRSASGAGRWNRVLIVRLGALGDIIHALPAVSALRAAHPTARIEWLVDERYREILDLVPGIDRRIVWRSPRSVGPKAALQTIRAMRREHYDVAVDFQGLLKSAILARITGANEVIGFSTRFLRERAAGIFYSRTHGPAHAAHVVEMNLSLVGSLGVGRPATPQCSIAAPPSPVPAAVRAELGVGSTGRFAVMNPAGGWPNKRWPPERFGAVAAALRDRHQLASVVIWGPGETGMASEVVATSRGAARLAPPTTLFDLVALIEQAHLVVSGDTGPLHIAAALGTPVVGIYGPTNPARNGSWSAADLHVSRFPSCVCHHHRRCRSDDWCLARIEQEEVIQAVDRRLESASSG